MTLKRAKKIFMDRMDSVYDITLKKSKKVKYMFIIFGNCIGYFKDDKELIEAAKKLLAEKE